MLNVRFGILNEQKLDTDKKVSEWKDEFAKQPSENLKWIKIHNNQVSGKNELQLFIIFNEKSKWVKTLGQSVTKRYVLEQEELTQAEDFLKAFELAKQEPEVAFSIIEHTDKEGKSELRLLVQKVAKGNAVENILAAYTGPLHF